MNVNFGAAPKAEYELQQRQVGSSGGCPIMAKIAIQRPRSARLRLEYTEVDADTRMQKHEIYSFECPGCGGQHRVDVGAKGDNGWNEDMVKPTFYFPLMNRRGEVYCEATVVDGIISFTAMSNHSNRSTVMPLEPME